MSIDQPLIAEQQLETLALCKNCEAPLAGKFCAYCGQADKHLDPSFHDLLHEATHEFLHLDGKILTTIKALLFQPGKLTIDYFAGRRACYIGPIRLYLTLSIIFFLFAAHASKSDPVVSDKSGGNEIVIKTDDGTRGSALEKQINGALKKTAEEPEVFKHAFLTNVSRVMFLMVPLFALGLKIAYKNRHRRYPGFVYFSLHYHSVIFFALIVSDLVAFTHVHTLATWVDRALALWCLLYLFMALRKVFGGTWKTTALRIAALGVVYLPCFGIGLAAAAIVSLFTI